MDNRKAWKFKPVKKGYGQNLDLYECACGAVMGEEEMEEHKQICQETCLEGG